VAPPKMTVMVGPATMQPFAMMGLFVMLMMVGIVRIAVHM
jgi:hypothetical protein